MTALNALQGQIGKSDKSNQNIVVDEKFVNNSTMDLNIFKLGGWNKLQPVTESCWKNPSRRINRGCWQVFRTETHSLRHNTWREILGVQINT